ncbi:MAG: hypothetical protein IT298_10415 [Chloroflexi bacterium]|nr:hypothetical protein [Chloroflexota bacterium]MBV6436036.1 ESX secretion system protein EccC [Anaerolineae bacterium]MDL1916479.1 hypothetical protein [Anaerolineae bacterium CFX4]OQY80788.1 MAG: hypothetical protein B6D42_12365 [Anaerolineae bacterium UTCFX5]MCC6566165.1 hypothetical protein [Chloroflexota bacterium]
MATQSQPVLINRPPRIQPDLPQAEFEVPPPPELELGNITLIQSFLPLITIIGYVIVSATGSGRNLALIIPMGLSVVASSGLAFWTYIRETREQQRQRESYEARLATLRREMEGYHDQQRTFYYYNYPNMERVLAIAENQERGTKDNRSGTRLWERRTTDPDFGAVRLGVGTQPSTVKYTFQAEANNEDPMMYAAMKLAEDSLNVTDIPVAIPLRPYSTDPNATDGIVGRHSIGVTGSNPQEVYDFVRALLVNFTAFHAPTDTRLYVFGDPSDETNWNWARYLPHSNSGNKTEPGDQLCFSPRQSAVESFWDMMIKSDLERRLVRLADDSSTDVTLPFLLVVVDQLSIESNPNSIAKGADTQEAASLIFRRGQELGATIIFLVPDAKYIPSQCETVIEVDSEPNLRGEVSAYGQKQGTLFRYTEVGVNTRRVIGVADTLKAETAMSTFSLKLSNLSVRSTFGTAGLPNDVRLLNLHDHIMPERLDASADGIWEKWRKSREATAAEWLRVPIGFLPGPKRRDLLFSANGDGVHGMIAGTTGSGKSELLITLILGMAMKYDPSVINFVLVDYKGGTAFKMFERLPHVVNLVTSLQGNAGARTFIALQSEMKRRAKMLADQGVPHIVDYREKGYHRTDLPMAPETKVKHKPFPFLFVIIDEFAEMVKEMPQFKADLDSVTRLGRAYGVTLILATQRPTGAVTDQMRANIKFKICLRVETAEDSRELLRASDAAFLPTGVPGRAYLMVGNDSPQLMQVAYASYNYIPPTADSIEEEKPPVIKWFDRPKKKEKKSASAASLRTVADRVVEICAALAIEKPDVVEQEKPWPDPLPVQLPLNAEYITSAMQRMPKVSDIFADEEKEPEIEAADEVVDDNPMFPLSRNLKPWIDEIMRQASGRSNGVTETTTMMADGSERWPHVDWSSDEALSGRIGMIDDPYHARQLPLDLDLKAGSVLVYGASGKGKTGFLRTLITSLAVRHSPDALWIYAFDFGGGGLTPIENLPHVGAVIDSEENERVTRLLNRLKQWVRERAELFGGDSLSVYNRTHPNAQQPAVLVVLDNYAEFRQRYEDAGVELASLLREGASKGIFFAVTADQLSTVPGRIAGLFNQRLSLKLSDPSEYSGIVGRVPADLDDIPGRGYIPFERAVLECHIAKPLSIDLRTAEGEPADESVQLAALAEAMNTAWTGQRPQPVETLESIVALRDMTPLASERRIEIMLGKALHDLQPIALNLKEQGPHLVVGGSPLSGRTTTLRSMVLSLADRYAPDRLGIILIDAQKRMFEFAEGKSLANLPHVRAAISEQNREMIDPLIESLRALYTSEGSANRPELFIFIDNYDDFSDLFDRKAKPLTDLANLARRYGSDGLHFVIGMGASPTEDLLKVITRSKVGLALDPEAAGKAPFNLTAAGKLARNTYPVGRGFLIGSGRFTIVQISTPYPIENADEIQDSTELQAMINVQLGQYVDDVMAKWDGAPQWDFQIKAPEPGESNGAAPERKSSGGGSSASGAASGPVLPAEYAAKLRDALKEIAPIAGIDMAVISQLEGADLLRMASSFEDMVDLVALAAEAKVKPEALLPVFMGYGMTEEDARKALGLSTEKA